MQQNEYYLEFCIWVYNIIQCQFFAFFPLVYNAAVSFVIYLLHIYTEVKWVHNSEAGNSVMLFTAMEIVYVSC